MGDENSDVDLGRETIEQLTASNQFVASAEIVRIADRMWDALLDVQSHGRR